MVVLIFRPLGIYPSGFAGRSRSRWIVSILVGFVPRLGLILEIGLVFGGNEKNPASFRRPGFLGKSPVKGS